MARYDISGMPQKLKRERLKRRLTLTRAAALSGLSYSSIDKVENGITMPRLITLLSLLEAYGLTFEDVAERMDHEETNNLSADNSDDDKRLRSSRNTDEQFRDYFGHAEFAVRRA